MDTQTGKTMKSLEILNDLIKIQDDRVSGYRQALSQLINMDSGLRCEIDKIIADGEYYKQQLSQKIKELSGTAGIKSIVSGKIYNAWRDLKVIFSGITQKSIIDCSQYNETVALYAYEAALDKNIEIEEDTRQLVEKQENELRKINDEIKKYKKTYRSVDYITLLLV